jgi:hypothetical protein
MANMLEECTTKEQRSAVHFMWAKGLNAKDIHKEMFPVYGEKCLSHRAVHNSVEKFSQGHPKAASRRITIDSVTTVLGCSHGLAHSIMCDCFKFQKVRARWVPPELMDQEK